MKLDNSILLCFLLGSLFFSCQDNGNTFDIKDIQDDFGTVQASNELNFEDLPIWNDTLFRAWSFIKANQLGLQGRRPLNNGAFLGTMPVKKKYFNTLAVNNWFPLLPQKVTICGKFDHFNTHHSTASGEEKDWNIFVKPDSNFSFITQLAELYKNINLFKWDKKGGTWKMSKSGETLVEGEITPFSTSNNESILGFPIKNHENAKVNDYLGTTICLYGPPVREYVHNNRPEIHPSEIIWWKKDTVLRVIALQDASSRFNEKKHYRLNKNKNYNGLWHPWSEAVSQFELLIPFSLEKNAKEELLFKFYEEEKKALEEPDTLQLIIDGKPYLKVLKYMPSFQHLQFQFVEVSKNRREDSIIGFIKVNFTLGKDTPLDETLIGLRIESNYFMPTEAILNNSKDKFVIETVDIYPKKEDGRLSLFADYALEYEVQKYNFAYQGTDELINQQNRSARTSTLRGIPFKADKNIKFKLANLEKDTTLPDFEIEIFPLSEIDEKFIRAGNRTTKQFKKFTNTQKTDLKACALKRAEIIVNPFYVFCEEGDCNIEDEAEEISQLNAWAQREMDTESKSYQYNWDFKIIPLDTMVNLQDSLYINYIFNQKSPARHQLTIDFLEQDRHIFKLLATVAIKDTFGLVGSDTLTLFSHQLNLQNNGINIPFENANDFLKKIVSSFDIDYRLIETRIANQQKGKFPVFFPETSIPDIQEMKYQATINYFQQIIDDNHMNHNELEGLIKSIKNLPR